MGSNSDIAPESRGAFVDPSYWTRGDPLKITIGGIAGAFWPVVFGYMLSTDGGVLGMAAALVLFVPMVIGVTRGRDRLWETLSKGSLVLGLLSLFPPVPVLLGIIPLGVVAAVFGRPPSGAPDSDDAQFGPNLDFFPAALATVLYAGVFILCALGVGAMINAWQKRRPGWVEP